MNIRGINESDFEACNNFYNNYYDKNRTISQWNWEFMPGLETMEMSFVITENNGEIIGTQALIPLRLLDEQGEFWSAKSEETLIMPNYRGQELFRAMYMPLLDNIEQDSIEVIWGFTSAHKPFERSGFKVPGDTNQLILPLSGNMIKGLANRIEIKTGILVKYKTKLLNFGLNLAKILSLSKLKFQQFKLREQNSNKCRIITATEPPREAGEICRQFIKQWGGITLMRDYDYLNWRIFENPYLKSTMKLIFIDEILAGWIIYSMGSDSVGYIIDILVTSENYSQLGLKPFITIVLLNAVEELKKMGSLGIRAWSINNHPFDNIISKVAQQLGFYQIHQGQNIVIFIPQTKQYRPSFSSFDNWYINRIYTQGTEG